MTDARKIILYIFGGLLLLLLMSERWQGPSRNAQPTIAYSVLKTLARDGKIIQATLIEDRVEITLHTAQKLGPNQIETNRARSYLPNLGDPELLPLFEAQKVVIESRPSSTGLGTALLGILPWLVFIGVWFWFQSRMYRNMGGPGSVGLLGDAAKTEAPDRPKITFSDVAGQESAKAEVAELVSFLQNPERYHALGAEAPRGVLLMGPPGTGKTLLARALAGEAGVPFYSTSASEFIEMYVGVGAARVRRMFAEAKKRAPSIIFMDELDSIGRVRGTGLGGGHDEREQTLNQILSEMDGFSGREAVIVLAATNRPDILDPALLRPGRFDRHVTLELPDLEAREAILKVHTRKVPLGADVDLTAIAAGTPGFSGADLKNLVNEAAMAAVRDGKKTIGMEHMDAMRDKVLMGTVRTLAIQPDERHRLAVHEAGHTVAAFFLPNADPVYKVTIIPRGRALGATQTMPKGERHTLPQDYLEDRLAVTLAGRAAEKVLLGIVSSGADDDIREATKLSRAMVARWGMAEAIGPMDVRHSDDHPFLGREIASPRAFSDATAHAVDLAVKDRLETASKRAESVLKSHQDGLTSLVAALESQETLDAKEITACLKEVGKLEKAEHAGS